MDLNIRLISENNLSPDEYVYLYIVYKNAQNLLDKVKLKYDPTDLQLRGWVNENTVTEKFLDLFVSDVDAMFAELISIYLIELQRHQVMCVYSVQKSRRC